MIKRNRNKIFIGICIVILLASAAGSVWVLLTPHGTQVNIIQDGAVLYTFDLSKAEDQTFDIAYGDRSNKIQIKDGKIRVLEADCPDQICVHMGWLESGAMPIVCLPNHLVIEFADAEEEVDSIAK